MGILNLLNEKFQNSLAISASMLTKTWSIDLMKKYGYIVTLLVKSIIGIPVAVLLVPVAIIVLPIINLVSNLLLAAATFILSPLTAVGLTAWHVGKDFYRKDKMESLYTNTLARANIDTWDQYVTSAIKDYKAFSPESQKLKEDLLNKTGIHERKESFCKFFGLVNHKNSYEEYNAGKGITDRILSNAESINNKM